MKAIYPLVALGVGLLLLAAVIPVAFIQTALATTAAIAWLAAGWTLVSGRLGRGKYDLGELREVHERAEIDAINDDGVPEGNVAVCINCGTPYDDRILRCPNCKSCC